MALAHSSPHWGCPCSLHQLVSALQPEQVPAISKAAAPWALPADSQALGGTSKATWFLVAKTGIQ